MNLILNNNNKKLSLSPLDLPEEIFKDTKKDENEQTLRNNVNTSENIKLTGKCKYMVKF